MGDIQTIKAMTGARIPTASPEFYLRPAQASDDAVIRSRVNGEHLNPMGLVWSHFVVAISSAGEVIGCGQIKPHGDGSHELASIVVARRWRGKGVARAIIEHLIEAHPGTLYLTAHAKLGPLYEKFGFRVVAPDEMTPYFRKLSRVASVIKIITLGREGMLVMIRQS